jgi:hypothetical protein
MLLRSASSPLLNCARAPGQDTSPSAARQGAALRRAMSEGDLAAPIATLPAVVNKDDGRHGCGRAPTPLLSASSSVQEEEDQ